MPKAVEKNISLQFYTEYSLGKWLLGDPTRLRQILLNLLSNAVKFTDTGGVMLSVSIEQETENNITLRFEVKDTGIGMTPEQSKRILEPFMQADESTTRKYGGTGLGMAITKNIIGLMGGKIEIESKPGAGSAISFELTLDTMEVTPETSETANVIIELDKPTFEGEVLVCEDNQMNQRVIIDHLDRVGLRVHLAQNGLEGIEKVRERAGKGMRPFDLILMDIHMPVMDGMAAATGIMQMETGAPIVAMTANIMSDDRELYKKAGMNNYVGKPFTSQELWHCLLKYLKPVRFTNAKGKEQANAYTPLQVQLKTDFVKNNQNRFDEIKNGIESGDIILAHRLAHNLKSNAGLIGRTALHEAAAAVEAALKNGECMVTEAQMNILRSELSGALNDLNPYLKEETHTLTEEEAAVDFNAGTALELLNELEPLLKSGNTECLKMIERLKAVPGSGELVRQMEDFYFGAAMNEFSALKTKLEERI